MKINLTWLQEYIKEPLPPVEELVEKIIFNAFEVESTVQDSKGNTILDIKTLPDRNHDCLSYYGIAREICGLYGFTFQPLPFRNHESIAATINVSISSNYCKRYIARKIINVQVKESPRWLTERLESIGQRSINNVVDATNYVMMVTGNPTHVFDADKFTSSDIIIRHAQSGEQMTTLDGTLVPLDESMLVITNPQLSEPLALAGVKGGKIAQVDEQTSMIILEVANFEGKNVRKTAKKTNITTDASKRFENEFSSSITADALHLLTDVITEVAGGQPEDPVDMYPVLEETRTIIITPAQINKLLGTDFGVGDITQVFDRYQFDYITNEGSITLTVPHYRLDLVAVENIAEEIGRITGYEKIKAIIPELSPVTTLHDTYAKTKTIREYLLGQGYREVITSAFSQKGDYEVVHGPVGKSALRKSLELGLTQSFGLNKQHVDLLGIDELKIFEIGTIFPKQGEEIVVGILNKNGFQEKTLDDYISENHIEINYNIPEIVEKNNTPFIMWSNYPYTTRDIAVWLPQETDPKELERIIKNNGTSLLQGVPTMFDTFTKDGRTSYAYRMVFQSFEKTLTDEEVNTIMETITDQVKSKDWEVR